MLLNWFKNIEIISLICSMENWKTEICMTAYFSLTKNFLHLKQKLLKHRVLYKVDMEWIDTYLHWNV